MIKGFKGIEPKIDESVFVAQSADIIGEVVIEKNASIWYKMCIRDSPKPDDVADALAVAICHAHANRLEKTLKNIGGQYV